MMPDDLQVWQRLERERQAYARRQARLIQVLFVVNLIQLALAVERCVT